MKYAYTPTPAPAKPSGPSTPNWRTFTFSTLPGRRKTNLERDTYGTVLGVFLIRVEVPAEKPFDLCLFRVMVFPELPFDRGRRLHQRRQRQDSAERPIFHDDSADPVQPLRDLCHRRHLRDVDSARLPA